MIPLPFGICYQGNCLRRAVSMAYDEKLNMLVPVCRRHILAYPIMSGRLWQAEDEWLELQFCRQSRWRWLAQRRVLADQRFYVRYGRPSPAQLRLIRDVADE